MIKELIDAARAEQREISVVMEELFLAMEKRIAELEAKAAFLGTPIAPPAPPAPLAQPIPGAV